MATTLYTGNDFDAYTTIADLEAPWSQSGSPGVDATGGTGGSPALSFTSGNQTIYSDYTGTDRYFSILARCEFATLTNQQLVLGMTGGQVAPLHLSMDIMLRLETDGSIDILRGTGAGLSLLASTATGVITAATQHVIELRFFKNNSGTYNLYVDGTEVVVDTAGDTSFSTTANSFWLGRFFYLNNNTIIDDVVIRTDDTAYPALAATNYVVGDFSGAASGGIIVGVGSGTLHNGEGVGSVGVSNGTGVGG